MVILNAVQDRAERLRLEDSLQTLQSTIREAPPLVKRRP